MKEASERSPALSTMWEVSKKTAISEPGSGLSPDTESASALIIGFPSLQNFEKQMFAA